MKKHFIILLLLLFISNLLLHSQTDEQSRNIKIENVSNLVNLPNTEVRRLFQDSDGFIWIATTGGLYQFDGYNLKEFRSNIHTPELLTSNKISCLFEDGHKNILIGTNNGLNIYNKINGKITKDQNEIFKHNNIEDIILTPNQKLWIGTEKGIFESDGNTYTKILNHNIKDLYVDSKNNIWAATWSNGVFRFDDKKKTWIHYPKLNQGNSAHIIYEDTKGRIWIGSFGYGIVLLDNAYDVNKVKYTRFTANDTQNRISDNYIYSITEDTISNILFFGTRKGISFTNTNDKEFVWNNIFPSYKNQSLSFNEVNSLIKDKQGNIWIGTLGGGISYIKIRNSKFQSNLLMNAAYQLHSNSVRSILTDNKGQVWLGIGSNGMAMYNGKETKVFYTLGSKDSNNSFTRIYCITQSEYDNSILIGSTGIFVIDNNNLSEPRLLESFQQRNILQIIHSKNNGFWIAGKNVLGHLNRNLNKEHIINSERNEYNTVLQTDENTIWTGTTSNGIIKITFNKKNFKVISTEKYDRQNQKSPAVNIRHLFQDSENRIWAGSDGGGLCVYNPQKDCFESINKMTDFPTDIINSITEDKDGSLWLGSNIGLIRFYPASNLKNSIFRLYDKSNGLPDNQFLPRAVSQSDNGEIYFGTHHGYIHFYPNEINTFKRENDVFITDFKINSKSIESDIIPGYAKEVNVPGNYSNFTIEFSPMLYTAPDKVRYTYKLEGYDKEWQYSGAEKRFAYYTNLPPGKYHFKLKCTDEYGKWNNLTRELDINILPPIYMTWWAYCIYIILSIIIVVYIYRSAKQRIRLRTAMQIQKIEQEKTNEVNQAKLRFFTNITHELFTPITIISAAMEDSRNLIPKKDYEIISQNTNRLIRLIQQILEFRKAETGNLKLQVTKQDLSAFIAKNIESFQPLMKQKNISIEFISERTEFQAFFDADKIDKILYNLLSNALKYNTEGAHVEVILTPVEDGKRAEIQVKDNGKGLTERTMKNLFKRFYDGDFRKFNTSGTGIGLSLVKDLVVLHKGEIKVDNHPGEGVNFIINIPVNSDAFTAEECNENRQQSELAANDEQDPVENAENNEFNILIVEDNQDLVLLMKNILSRKYNVFTAGNGKEAMEILKEQDIQLVVSDVMMPEMNGYELCETIKNDIEYNHIPIILLTAKTSEEDVVEAYQSGADGYLKKPFSVNVLQARITNLLLAREKRIQKFKGQMVFKPQEIDYTTPDEEFIKQVMDCVYQHYSEPDFDQNKLADILGYSKSTLYRKLKSLTGMSTSNLIKDVRLKRAYELLNKKGGTRISDIAYMVGFNDPKYFGICFKKEFGILPSEIEK